jgi:hypothetical protein
MPPVITAREQLRAMVEEVPDDLLRDAIYALTHLEDDEPLSEQEAEDLKSAHDDLENGRMIPLSEYKKQRGL